MALCLFIGSYQYCIISRLAMFDLWFPSDRPAMLPTRAIHSVCLVYNKNVLKTRTYMFDRISSMHHFCRSNSLMQSACAALSLAPVCDVHYYSACLMILGSLLCLLSCAAAGYHQAACVAPRQYRLWGSLELLNHDAAAISCLRQQSARKPVSISLATRE